jgi:heat shock protein HtpX
MTTYDFVSANKRKTVVLIAVFSAFVIGIAWIADRIYDAGGSFVMIAAVYSSISALVSYYTGDKIALALSGAVRVTETEHPYLVRMVDNLCIATGMPKPKIHIINDTAINAFATGRDPEHASIAVTTGAIQKLENEELEGVIAHELSHIKNYDIRVMTVVIVLVGIVSVLADLMFRMSWHSRDDRRREGGNGNLLIIIGIVLMILAPIVAQLIKLAVSRKREYLADASGALMTRFPQGLASALRKIGAENRPMQSPNSSTAHLFIANPFSGRMFASLFSTHPPIEARIAELEKMAG